MFEYIIFILFIFVFTLSIADNLRLRIKRSKLIEQLLQSTIDNNILKDDVIIKNSQEYVNFLIKSRDESYTYIEQLHESFLEYKNKVDDVIEHFNKFGIVATGDPLHKQMTILCEASKELQKSFPNK